MVRVGDVYVYILGGTFHEWDEGSWVHCIGKPGGHGGGFV